MKQLEGVGFILLAGGKSTRMGRDKALLPWMGGTFLSAQTARAERLGFGEILISSGEHLRAAEHRPVPDVYPGQGPLGGIYSCLLESRFPKNLVLPVDLPLAPEETLLALVARSVSEDTDITVLRHHGALEPLISVFDRRCLERMRENLIQGRNSVRRLYETCGTAFFDYEGDEALLRNINREEDFEQLAFPQREPLGGGTK